MKKNKIKTIFYIVLLIILIVLAIIVTILIFNKHSERNLYEDKNQEVVQQFRDSLTSLKENNEENKKRNIELEFEGYKVIGIIKIPKIDLEYPILEETTQATMKTSISRFWGSDINSFGNVSLAGHNNYDGTMFGKNKKLEIGDIVELTDLTGLTIQYEIKEIFKTDPNDVTILQTTNSEIREVTLITCTNGRAERLIIKAVEK